MMSRRRIAANIAKLPELLRFGTETRNTGRLSMMRILGMHSGIPMSPSAAPMIRQRRTCIEQFTHDVVLRVISSSPGALEPVFDAMLENAVRICGAKFGKMSERFHRLKTPLADAVTYSGNRDGWP